MNDKISIIVPIYNKKNSIEKCIQSLIYQTYKNIEIILVDDGSYDASSEICEKYQKYDSRIKVYIKKNGGVSSARNYGLSKAQGRYIMFCDADDDANSNWCESMLDLITKNTNNFIICGYNWVENNNIKSICYSVDENITTLNQQDFYSVYMKVLFAQPWNKIYDNNIIKDNNIKFEEGLSLGEDLLFNLQYFNYIDGKLIILNKELYNYKYEDINSLSRKYYNNMEQIQVRLNKCLLQTINKKKCDLKWEDIYYKQCLYTYHTIWNNIFNKSNKSSLNKKINHCQKIMNSQEFKICKSYIRRKDISFLTWIPFKSGIFIIYWASLKFEEMLYKYKIQLKNYLKIIKESI